ncbi:unnamed protein product [Phytophthora lilii]|uniref:Unnamed protein product n=1 Tax=Phytophthora lilii TaxID=2077276 RepID=A0A9W6YK03_9STRA|nr:unnamed protein product [Phytophthora lilii]
MDVWGSQSAVGEQPAGEEEDWEVAESGKDALIVLLDVRKAMFSPYPHAAAGAPSTWFQAVVELVIKLLKSKVVANDNSLLSVVFFGTVSGWTSVEFALLETDLKRTLNLFYITPPGKVNFDLSKFYGCSFKDFSVDEDEEVGNELTLQPAFPVASLDDLMDGSLRKRFRKRRLTTFPLHITKGVSIGVELYALVVVQRKNTPVALDASTNIPLKTETKWLCEDTGAYLTPDQIKKYIDYGGKRVYFTRDDVVEIKHYDAPGLQLICFKPLSSLKWNENIRSPYFMYPCDGYIEGSSTAFMAILNSMVKKNKFALGRLIARKTSEPRLVALIPQEEENDEMGQVQPSGFNVIFLPYLDDIRDIPAEAVMNGKLNHYTSAASGGRKTTTKKSAKAKAGKPEAEATFDREEWAALVASNAIQKKTVAQLKAFLHAHGLAAVGRKAELVDAVKSFVGASEAPGSMNFLKTLGGLVGSSATGGLPYSMDAPSMDGNVAAGGAAGESVVFEGLPDFVLHSGKSKQDPSHAVSIFKSRQPAGQLTQNALRRIKTLRHPNILAYLDGIEIPSNGPVIIVTEHVMPLSEFLTALRMEYGANSEEFMMCVSWGLRSILMALQFINVDCKLLHGRLTPQSIFVTKGGDWKLGGFELTAEITSDGPSYIYTAFQQDADVNYKSPGAYFDTPFIKRMNFLENLAVKDSDEKVAFYKELCANLETLPRCFGVHKILPALKQVVEFGAATGAKNGPVKLDPSASHMLPAMIQIGSSLSAEEFKAEVLPIIVKLFSCNDRAVRVQLLQMMEKFAVHFDAKLVNSLVVFDNLCSGFTDAAPVLRELTVKSMLHIADKLSDSNLNNRVMKYFAKLQSDPEPAIRTNTTICLGKIASKLNDATRPKVLFPAFARALRDPFPHARLAGLRSMTACQEYFTPQGMAGSIVPAISPLLIDVSITVRHQAKISMDLFMKKVMDEAAQMKIREEQEAKERELKCVSGEHTGDVISPGATPPPSNGAHGSGGYASSLTAWASSAVASNVNKLVGAGGSTSALSASGSSVGASSSRSSSFSSSKNQNNTFGSATALSSKHNSLSTFPADDLAAEDGWGDDDDLDGLDSPKHTNMGLGSSRLSVNRGIASSFTSPAASSLSASLSSSSSSVKLNVARNTGTGSASSTTHTTPATSSFTMNSDSAWGDDADNWGGDDDLDFGVSAAPKSSSSMGSQKSGSGLNVSARASSLSTSFAAPGSSGGLPSGRKTASERRAEAQAKNKAKHEPLGAMKLSSGASAKADDWNWDF